QSEPQEINPTATNGPRDLAEALDSGGSDSEMERGIMQIQEHSVEHKAKMWKIALNVSGKGDSLSPWDGVLDLPEQTLIHNRSQQLIGDTAHLNAPIV
uniref:Uncharacterized protein n=1 Tax=Xiphophorus couchianus TaxID=32473 RepID=A0A3B5LJE7_9TELE